MTTTTTQNWLGISIDFDSVDDKTSESNFELLPEGFYKAKIKNVIKSVIGKNNKPALTVTLELEEGEKEIIHNLFLPETGDSEEAIEFKNKNLRNFFTRCLFSKLTKDEYFQLLGDDKNEALKKMQTSLKGAAQFIGVNTLVHIKQEPFIAQDKETKAIKFTDKSAASLISLMPKRILKLIADKEKAGIEMDKFPVILFSNKITAYGFGFYNDYDTEVILKNSKAYDFVQSMGGITSGNSEETTTNEPTVPKF